MLAVVKETITVSEVVVEIFGKYSGKASVVKESKILLRKMSF